MFDIDRFNQIASKINHSDKPGSEWNDQNKVGGLAQSIPEWRTFLEFSANYFRDRNIGRPVVLEIGTQDNYQKQFYEEFLGAYHIGIDIDPSVKGEVDIVGNSHSEGVFYEVQKRLKGACINLLFIDGDHSYNGTKKDFELYSPMTRHLVAIHDVCNFAKSNPDFPPVETARLWKELQKKEKDFTFLTIHKPRKHELDPWVDLGIGLIVKE